MTTPTLMIERRLVERRLVERRRGPLTAPGGAVETAQLPATTTTRVSPLALVRWIGKGLVNLALVAALAVFLGLAVGPHLFGYRTMTMLTGSMTPVINPGDVTVVTPLAAADVRPGMIISYHIPVLDHHVVSHRVLTVTRGPDGATTVQTKGDANTGKDPWTATLQGDTAYQVRGVVPLLGSAVSFLRTPGLQQALLYGVPTVLAGWVLFSLWAPRRTKGDA